MDEVRREAEARHEQDGVPVVPQTLLSLHMLGRWVPAMSEVDNVFVKRAHMGWTAIEAVNGIHVVPVEDLMLHTVGDCACGPDPMLVETGPVGDVWMLVHHSLDGRERYERPAGTMERTHVTEEEPHG